MVIMNYITGIAHSNALEGCKTGVALTNTLNHLIPIFYTIPSSLINKPVIPSSVTKPLGDKATSWLNNAYGVGSSLKMMFSVR